MRTYVFIICVTIISCSDKEVKIDCSDSNISIAITKIKYADCGLDNGAITVEAANGAPLYSFQLDESSFVSSPEFSDVKPGNHRVTVKDMNGCTKFIETYVGSKEPFLVNTTTTPSGCGGNSGSITVQPLGGLPPYKYQLGENNDNYQQSNIWNGLTSGEYSIWVEDANTCFFGIYVFIPSGASYSQTIKPIIEISCSKSGCHDGTQPPDLRTLTSIRENAIKVKDQVTTGKMPPGSPLKADEINNITCWINDKMPNN